MHSRTATDLPELRQHIARYLDFDTLKTFSLVCKAWHLDAHPILWDRFSCTVPWECSAKLSPRRHAAWLDTIHRNASLFRHVHYNIDSGPIVPEVRDLLLGRCHGLVTIDAIVTAPKFFDRTLVSMIKQNKDCLRQLRLRVRGRSQFFTPTVMARAEPVIQPDPLPPLLPSLLASLSRLRLLELGLSDMAMEDLLLVLGACSSSVESLVLYSSIQKTEHTDSAISTHHLSSISITTANSLRLRQLRIHYICAKGVLEVILSCLATHSLEELKLGYVRSLRTTPELPRVLWRLTRLHLDGHTGLVLSTFLDAIHPHQLRSVHLSNMGTECTASLLEQQHQNLETLNVTFMMDHRGALGDILATCSKLKRLVFKANAFVDLRMLIDPQRPWVCTELEVFEGYFGLSPFLPEPPSSASGKNSDDEQPHRVENLFMQRLGQLTKLRKLVRQKNRHPAVRRDKNVMAWSLSSGLKHLAGLSSLQTLEFADRHLPRGIGVAETVFIKQHWHCLQELTCKYIYDAAVRQWLATEWPELLVTLNWWD
ncbi:MAG: hypothetical protein J3Q66DRAFT_445245 [Benniella sp.]|nr:MAG: hypothetical protein J3Q66DRAFT_445245 [Benniella sp.]